MRLATIIMAVACVATGSSACATDEGGTPCATDAECDAGQICGGETCRAPGASERAALVEVEVPAGESEMGCTALDPSCEAAEQPAHRVTVPAFRIDRTEVTARDFADFLTQHGSNTCDGDRCVNASAETLPIATSDDVTWTAPAATAAQPMTDVSWFGAKAYCAWRGQRLCSEAEWEKAARGGCEFAARECGSSTRRYPWGDAAPDCTLAHMFEGDYGCGTNTVASADGAGYAGESPYGAVHMAGNVWEWVEDTWHESYEGAPSDGSAWVDPDGKWRVIKGGGAGSDAKFLRGATRGNSGPRDAYKFRGFRCCRTAP